MATGGPRVLADYQLANCPALDVVLVPGGWGTRREMNNHRLLEWITQRGAQARLLTSVCTGALLLGQAGLLDGKRATTHWQALSLMQERFRSTCVEHDLHVVEDGNLLTSAGISAGIDLALRVVWRYYGESVARATARHMEYPFPENNARRIAPEE